ncbi:hypothetical protein NHX12_017426 [Muraenolepis orangiensis]|uniref:Secreted protein n=1 Tax=Muraenolepis orangiensis TaxID=630683 RepID=A0A9Q0DB69_9TELE|nr:hypothetical protein NHX12_017426 [Muraenolepis orangiensis]
MPAAATLIAFLYCHLQPAFGLTRTAGTLIIVIIKPGGPGMALHPKERGVTERRRDDDVQESYNPTSQSHLD